jgi:hypothetical protein
MLACALLVSAATFTQNMTGWQGGTDEKYIVTIDYCKDFTGDNFKDIKASDAPCSAAAAAAA